MAKATKAELNRISGEVEKLVIAFNEANQEGKFDDASALDAEITENVNKYTAIAREITFKECKAADDPMYEACRRVTFDTIRVKDVPIEGSTLKKREITETSKNIELKELSKYCGGIGHDEKWLHAAEKFNMLLTAQVAKDLGLNPKEVHDSYAMGKIAREIELGKNPTSNTNLLKTLTGIIQMMLGEEYKPTSHDVKYLLWVYAKKGRSALSVVCANHRYMRSYLQAICHRMIIGEKYVVEYKKVKEKA